MAYFAHTEKLHGEVIDVIIRQPYDFRELRATRYANSGKQTRRSTVVDVMKVNGFQSRTIGSRTNRSVDAIVSNVYE